MSEQMSKEEVSIAKDLQNKCSSDVVHTIMRSINLLGNNGATKLYVACGGVTAAGSVVAVLMGSSLLGEDSPPEKLADGALLGLIFAWLTKDPSKEKGTTVDLLRHSVDAWEVITGRTFDNTWLRDELRELL